MSTRFSRRWLSNHRKQVQSILQQKTIDILPLLVRLMDWNYYRKIPRVSNRNWLDVNFGWYPFGTGLSLKRWFGYLIEKSLNSRTKINVLRFILIWKRKAICHFKCSIFDQTKKDTLCTVCCFFMCMFDDFQDDLISENFNIQRDYTRWIWFYHCINEDFFHRIWCCCCWSRTNFRRIIHLCAVRCHFYEIKSNLKAKLSNNSRSLLLTNRGK